MSRSVAFVTPRVGRKEHALDNEWLQVSLAAQTVVLYMAGKQAGRIAQELIACGKSVTTPVCVVENASSIGARFRMSLSELARDGLPEFVGPVSLLMGEALMAAQVSDLASRTVVNEQAVELAVG